MIGGGVSLSDPMHGPNRVKLTVFLVVGVLIGVAVSSVGGDPGPPGLTPSRSPHPAPRR